MIRIEPVKRSHVEGLWKAMDTVAREDHHLIITQAPPLRKIRKNVLESILKKVTHFVALDKGKVVGWCHIRLQGHPTLNHVGSLVMGLIPEYRGKGVGTCLVRKCLEHARHRKLEYVRLQVYASNKAARRLYRKMGFHEEGLLKKARKYKGVYQDIVCMVKKMEPRGKKPAR